MRWNHANSPLQTLIAALPDEALRPLVLALLLNGASPPIAEAAAPPASPRRRPGRPRKGATRSAAEVRAARNERQAESARRRRAAAREAAAKAGESEATSAAAKEGNGTSKIVETSNEVSTRSLSHESGGNGSDRVTKAARALAVKAFWGRAEEMSPGAPWRAAAEAFNLNSAVCVDAHRSRTLPPGLDLGAVARFVDAP